MPGVLWSRSAGGDGTAGANVRNICIGSRAAARVRVSNEVAMFVSQLPSLHPRPISRPCNLLLRSLEMICRCRARTKDANTQKHRDDFLPRVSTAARPLLSDLDRAGLSWNILPPPLLDIYPAISVRPLSTQQRRAFTTWCTLYQCCIYEKHQFCGFNVSKASYVCVVNPFFLSWASKNDVEKQNSFK